MSEFGSLVNVMQSGTRGAPEPEVGMGVTFLHYSDRSPGTIVGVIPFKSGPNKGRPRVIRIQGDKATRTDSNGMSESQTYVFEGSPDSPIIEAKFRKDGSYRTDGGTRVRIGSRDSYYDYSF